MSAAFLQNKRKIIFKATYILKKIPIWINLPSFCPFYHPGKKSVIEYAQFIGKERTLALFEIIICCKSTNRNGELVKKNRSARSFAAVQVSWGVQPLSMSVGSVRLSPNERVDSGD